MDINKAIRKQKKSYKIFMLIMCFIFFILPIVLYISGQRKIFFIAYLSIIEAMILLSMMVRTNNYKLKYECNEGKLKIIDGMFGANYSITYDKVTIVHTESREGEINLILITSSMFRNKRIKAVDLDFLKKNAYLSHEYNRIKKMYPESNYYYIIIKNGGYIKYKLLCDIYKSCVKANFTDDAIEDIKKGRM